MSRIICIDFGSAFTKVAVRIDLNKPSPIITDERLSSDPLKFCIPTLAAKSTRSDGVKWAFGPDASTQSPSEQITVFRNWKSQLFGSRKPERAVKEATVKYFEWLREFLATPCSKVGLKDLSVVPARICVPDFSVHGRSNDDFSPTEQFLQDALREAGWLPDDDRPVVTEPQSNIIGIYTQGANATSPPGASKGKKTINFMRMFKRGGYFSALKDASTGYSEATIHSVLVLDIGAYTSDFAHIEFDLTDAKAPPQITSSSLVAGIQQLDESVVKRLPKSKAAAFESLNQNAREAMKRAIYSEATSYKLPGNLTVGADKERGLIQECVDHFAEKVEAGLAKFILQNKIGQLNEVFLTGGGNMIPTINSCLEKSVRKMDLSTSLVHSLTGHAQSHPTYYYDVLGPLHGRGSSGLGGASVYFEEKYW